MSLGVIEDPVVAPYKVRNQVARVLLWLFVFMVVSTQANVIALQWSGKLVDLSYFELLRVALWAMCIMIAGYMGVRGLETAFVSWRMSRGK